MGCVVLQWNVLEAHSVGAGSRPTLGMTPSRWASNSLDVRFVEGTAVRQMQRLSFGGRPQASKRCPRLCLL